MINTDDFRYKGKPSCAITNRQFTVSQDEWDTMEDTGKSTKNALYVLRYSKRPKATSNSDKIKPVALAVIKLRLSEGIRQSISQLLSQ